MQDYHRRNLVAGMTVTIGGNPATVALATRFRSTRRLQPEMALPTWSSPIKDGAERSLTGVFTFADAPTASVQFAAQQWFDNGGTPSC